MQLSDKPTRHILVRAHTNSEWDCCDFAVILLSEWWIQQRKAGLKVIRPHADNLHLASMNYYDASVQFCQSEDDEVELLLKDRDWAFVEAKTDEMKKLIPPESSLDCHELVQFPNGEAKYTAFGKHTGEEFWTDSLPLPQIIEQLSKHEIL